MALPSNMALKGQSSIRFKEVLKLDIIATDYSLPPLLLRTFL